MPEEENRGRDKSRGKSEEPKATRSKSRGGGGGGSNRTRTTTTTTTETGGRRGKGKGGGEQHHEHHENQHKNGKKKGTLEERKAELDAEFAKAEEAKHVQKEKNDKVSAMYDKQVDDLLALYGSAANKWSQVKNDVLKEWTEDKITRDYENMPNEKKKIFDKAWRRILSKGLKEIFSTYKIVCPPSKRQIEKQYDAAEKLKKEHAEKAEQHKGQHMPKSHPDSDAIGLVPGGPTEMGAQMRYDPELWGAATHTRARDSLRYL